MSFWLGTSRRFATRLGSDQRGVSNRFNHLLRILCSGRGAEQSSSQDPQTQCLDLGEHVSLKGATSEHTFADRKHRVIWGAVCVGMGFVQSSGQLYATRFLLGLFEWCVWASWHCFAASQMRSSIDAKALYYTVASSQVSI
jgi:hypothetical protein